MTTPVTHYARVDDLHIAYQVVGDGPLDIVFMPEHLSHLDEMWQEPRLARVLERLAGMGRLIVFDNRGTGLSDPVAGPMNFDDWVDDLTCVLDAVQSVRAALVCVGGGTSTGAMFAASHPDRTAALVILGGWARLTRDDDYRFGFPEDFVEQSTPYSERFWGTGDMLRYAAPDLARDDQFREWFARYERVSASPSTAMTLQRMAADIDIRNILSTIQAPTLVMHRRGDHLIPAAHGQYLAGKIPGAEMCLLPGDAHNFFGDDPEEWLAETERFLTGRDTSPASDRVLATLLFVSIADAEGHLADLGDARWTERRSQFDLVVTRQIERFGGRARNEAGNEVLATFSGPAHAIRCGCAIHDGVRALGLEVRVGVHTGEVEQQGNEVAGIGVHLAHRVLEQARPAEVLVSRTVVDLVTGSGIEFADRGSHALKGIPGEWRLSAVESC